MKGMLMGAIMASAILSGGCVSVGRSVLDSSFQTNLIDRDDVLVYAEGDSVPQHVHVALLDAEGGSRASEGALLNKLREEAGKLGANAIIWGVTNKPGFVDRLFGINGAELHRSSAIAIYVPSLGGRGYDTDNPPSHPRSQTATSLLRRAPRQRNPTLTVR